MSALLISELHNGAVWSLALFLVGAVASSSLGETASGFSAEGAVRELFVSLMDAGNRGDVDAVMECYAKNAVLLPPDGSPGSRTSPTRGRNTPG